MQRVVLTPGYVLHRRPFRETSFLLEIFTREYGRLSLIAKGVRKSYVHYLGLLQPFSPLLISWAGKNELKVLVQAECRGLPHRLQKNNLFAGFYLNELLMILLHKGDACSEIFDLYEHTLLNFRHHDDHIMQKMLRIFEKRLIEKLGYSPFSSQHQWLATQFYCFDAQQGFMLTSDITALTAFSGKTLQAIANEVFEPDAILKEAKRLMRMILLPLLGTKSIYSRQLFVRDYD